MWRADVCTQHLTPPTVLHTSTSSAAVLSACSQCTVGVKRLGEIIHLKFISQKPWRRYAAETRAISCNLR